MIHCMEYYKEENSHGNIDALFNGMSLGQEDGTTL